MGKKDSSNEFDWRICRTPLSIVVYKRAMNYGFSHYFSLFSWYVYILVKYCFMLINIIFSITDCVLYDEIIMIQTGAKNRFFVQPTGMRNMLRSRSFQSLNIGLHMRHSWMPCLHTSCNRSLRRRHHTIYFSLWVRCLYTQKIHRVLYLQNRSASQQCLHNSHNW